MIYICRIVLQFVIVTALFLFSETIKGQTFTYNGATYKVISSTELTCVLGSDKINSGAFSSKPTGSHTVPKSAYYNGKSYTVTTIGEGAYWDCSGITSISIGNNITMIGQLPFRDCNKVTSLVIPKSVTNINPWQAFEYITSLRVDTRNTVYDSRDNCNSIIEKETNKLVVGTRGSTIPESVTVIGRNAFKNVFSNYSHETLALPDNITAIEDYAFYDCGYLQFNLPENLENIGESAFGFNYGITSLDIPSKVTSIGDKAFYRNTNLENLTLPNSLSSIGSRAFSECDKLASVTSYIKEPFDIGDDVFEDSEGNFTLATLSVPHGTKSKYQACEGWKYFSNIVELDATETNIAFADATVKSLCVANWDKNGDGELDMEEAAAVTTLGTVFKGNSEIHSFDELQYFTGLTEICDDFSGCSGLTSVTIPSSVTLIMSFAFAQCSGLTSINIPNGVTTIYAYTFNNCSGLVSVNIPNSVTSISSLAFTHCSSLASVVSEMQVPCTCFSNTFEGISESCTLTIPPGTNKEYIKAGWTKDIFNGGVMDASGKVVEPINFSVAENYILRNKKNGLYMNLTAESVTISETPSVLKFENADDGKYYITDGQFYVGLAGTNQWTMSTDADKKEALSIASITDNGKVYYLLRESLGMVGVDYPTQSNMKCWADKSLGDEDAVLWSIYKCVPGDANGDGEIDVTDIVGIANSILGRASNTFDATAADVNDDGVVDVTDIVVMANLILRGNGNASSAKVREVLQMLDPQ